MQKQNYLTALLLLSASFLYATHNRAGEIIFKKTGSLSVEATVITLTKASSINADRDSLYICWGDGTCDLVARSNGSGELLGNDRKKNLYTGTHTYLTQGVYVISMTDNNRNAGIINVNPPSSENIPFHLEATVRLMPDAAASTHSPVFLELPIDDAYIFQPFYHVPNAFDPDGDSLVYELVTPMAGLGEIVPNYSFPDHIAPGDDNKISLDPATGVFFWNAPIIPGAYNIAILVKSYRAGILVETTLRDITIDVSNSTNHPPELTLTPNFAPDAVTDVIVGETVEITVNATDPDPGQILTLTATGGAFENYFQEKAVFSATGSTGKMTWHVGAEYLREQPYQFVFKAKDDYLGAGLSTARAVRFRVKAATAVKEVSTVGALNLAPNPTTGICRVQLPRTNAASLRWHNAAGQLIGAAPLPAGATEQTLDLSDQPAGLYFIEIQTVDGEIYRGKTIKI